MSPLVITLIVIAVLIGILVALYFVGNKMQKKQMAQKEEMQAAAQQTSMLIIDKKRLRIKESGLPQMVIDQTPKLMRRTKLPIVKAKIGPRIMTMVADEKIFDLIPLKKEVKATISGIYITDVRGVRGPLEQPKQKEKFFRRMKNKIAKKDK